MHNRRNAGRAEMPVMPEGPLTAWPRSGGNVGIGFAAPINMARRVMDQLVPNGEVRRGQIGVSIRDLGANLAAKEGNQGAQIAEVASGSPEKAGLQKRDIVKAVDDIAIRSAAQLRNLIGLTPLGSRVELRFERNAAAQTATVEVGPAKSRGKTNGRVIIVNAATIQGSKQRGPNASTPARTTRFPGPATRASTRSPATSRQNMNCIQLKLPVARSKPKFGP
jgi:hypothetical protein